MQSIIASPLDLIELNLRILEKLQLRKWWLKCVNHSQPTEAIHFELTVPRFVSATL